jgi:hypothetical protein
LRTIELFIQDFDRADQGSKRYESLVAVVLRIAFLLAAERRRLLPQADPLHRSRYSVSSLAAELRGLAKKHGEDILDSRHGAWNRVLRAIQGVFRSPMQNGRQRRAHRQTIRRPGSAVSDRTVLQLLQAIEQFHFNQADRNEMRDIERIGRLHEELSEYTAERAALGEWRLGQTRGRRMSGTHYTPLPVAESLVRSTLEPLVYVGPADNQPGNHWKLRSATELLNLRICDPACGSGVLLIQACRYLADRVVEAWKDRPSHAPAARRATRLPTVEGNRVCLARRLVAERCLFGVDKNPLAVESAKLSLWLLVEAKDQSFGFLDHRLHCGDSLLGIATGEPGALATGVGAPLTPVADAPGSLEFPEVFDAVLANPPWGQKAVHASPAEKQFIRCRYPSCAGIFDLFRPFIERGVQLLALGGAFGMVLPDIVLLKDYPGTRKFLLDHLTIRAIDWWGQAFAAAAIDTITLVGIRAAPSPQHAVQVRLRQPGALVRRRIPQESFRKNPKYAFNLHLTATSRRVLERLCRLPTLGDYFEIHEGVHSGNLRAELFVDGNHDATCRPMYFGRDEIRPYALVWRGRYIRLGALPSRRSKTRYANAGRTHWFDQPKVLVRRTGDFVLAAPDFSGRYASNNFFVVFPNASCVLNLFGVCALLNSRFMTWFFRTIEPRQGRLFAELKIKHLRRFPLPEATSLRACERLNRLGQQRTKLASTLTDSGYPTPACRKLDHAIDDLVARLLGVAGLLPEPP